MEVLTVKGQSRGSVRASFPTAHTIVERALRGQNPQRSPARASLGLAAGVLCSLVALALLILFVLQLWILMPIAPIVPEAPDESCGNVESDVPTVPDIRGTPARLGPAFTC